MTQVASNFGLKSNATWVIGYSNRKNSGRIFHFLELRKSRVISFFEIEIEKYKSEARNRTAQETNSPTAAATA